ncbi:hypothetical protein A8U91_03048 [Halomonas elongata]|uniref:Uncharacterized protein n=1 Tax=Halomonas elongata TaxID=2746 RepID=A0A1B8NVH1_HALEL|nr:hypothetical protein A8U91_03048 [Halomonas elongata]
MLKRIMRPTDPALAEPIDVVGSHRPTPGSRCRACPSPDGYLIATHAEVSEALAPRARD